MAYFPSFALALFLVLSAIYAVFSRVLLLQNMNSTSPAIGSRVQFRCYGPAINQRGENFFQGGGKLGWYANGKLIATSSMTEHDQWLVNRDKYSVSWVNSPSYYFMLQIENIFANDTGVYKCALISADNNIEIDSSPDNLTVQFPPNNLYPQCNVDSIPNDSGSVTLNCRSQTAFPPVNLYWRSADGNLSNAVLRSPKGYSEVHVNINIPSANAEYICVSNYNGDFEQFTKPCRVYRPKISLDQTVNEVIEGEEAVFTCSVSAKPDPVDQVSWTAHPPLIASNKTSIDLHSISKLTISNVTAQDNGTEIMCHSRNLLGKNHAKKLLIVKTIHSSTSMPPVRVNIEPEMVQVMAGYTAAFKCKASPKKERYNYRWYYRGKEIESEKSPEKFTIEESPFHRLRIHDVDMKDNNATVSCVITYDEHTGTARATLIVIQSKIDVGPYVDEVSQGDQADSFYWKLIAPISGGLLCLVLLLIVIWLALKAKRNCSSSRTVSDEVRFVVADRSGLHPFNTESQLVPRSVNAPSDLPTLYCSNPKSINQERLTVILPPIPSIPSEDAGQGQDRLRKKLDDLEDYEDMDTIQRNFYHIRDEHNEYQHVIEDFRASDSLQVNTPIPSTDNKGTPEPLY